MPFIVMIIAKNPIKKCHFSDISWDYYYNVWFTNPRYYWPITDTYLYFEDYIHQWGEAVYDKNPDGLVHYLEILSDDIFYYSWQKPVMTGGPSFINISLTETDWIQTEHSQH